MKLAIRTSMAGVFALAALGGTAVQANAAATPAGDRANIVGGQEAESPFVVQLKFGDGESTYGCSGSAINDEWVLTARHCIEDATWMDVYYSNDVTSPGAPIAASQVYASPSGDVALVKLSQAKPINEYPRLSDGYVATAGDTGTIWGYGLEADKQRPTHLKKAGVNVLGESMDAFFGSAVHVEGDDGASNHGDSGGPLFVDGVIVGVCSTGDTVDPGSDIHAGSNYANLYHSRSWIKQTAGV